MSAITAMEKILRERYSPVSRDEEENLSDAIESLLARINDRRKTTQSILDETMRMIHRSFDFQYISILLRDNDGIYRYKVATGVSDISKKTLLSICLSEADLLDQSTYPSTSISNITKFFMSENEPYRPGEEMAFSRPKMLSRIRESPDDMLEGDFIEFFFRNRSNKIIGFIEAADSRNGKLPKRGTIIWLELIATLLGAILCDRLEG
ncbi:MAG: hypothetical protein OEV21_01220 [Thermoplasmata archaeon]|nr:hypothetical protein [Thermoplasmata archaeon]